MTSSYVYVITHKDSGKSYIGKSNDPENRWRGHQKDAQKGDPRPLYRAMRKHGVEAFTLEVFEEHPNNKAAYLAETYWITRLKEFGIQLYNLNDGGEGGLNPQPETRRKISEAAQNRPPISEETRRKLSEAKRGKKKSEEHRRKISEAQRNMSEETRRKIGEASRGRKYPPRSEEARRKISEAVKRRHAQQRLEWLLVDEQ